MSEYKIINSEVVNLYSDNNFHSEVVTQGLLWENVEIINKVDNWFKIKQSITSLKRLFFVLSA